MQKHKYPESAVTNNCFDIPAIKKEYLVYSPELDEIMLITKEKFLDSYMACDKKHGVFILAWIDTSYRVYEFYLIGEL